MKKVQTIRIEMVPNHFSHEVHHTLLENPGFYFFSSLVAIFPQLNDFMSIYRKQGKFELQVFDRLLKKFGRHHFKVPK